MRPMAVSGFIVMLVVGFVMMLMLVSVVFVLVVLVLVVRRFHADTSRLERGAGGRF
jgi:hypothetical protein